MSSTGRYQGPIPTKVSNLNSQYGCACVTKVAPLEELVDDCFKHSIDQLNDPHKVYVVKLFARYIVEAHCHENLSFLIEIFKYEYYFDKIINRKENSKTGMRERKLLLESVFGTVYWRPSIPHKENRADVCT